MKLFNRLFQVLVISLLAFNCSGSGFHATGRERTLLAQGDVHNGWYFAGSPQVDIDGTVNGDAFVAGGVVNVRGTIDGLLFVAGGEVTVTGTVTDRIICAGGVVRLYGKTAKSLFAGGGTVVLERGATVGEYLMAGGGEVRVLGAVARDAKIGASELTVSGEIRGDLDAGVERFATEPGSTVGGNLLVTAKDSGAVSVTPGTVLGKVEIRAGRATPAPRPFGMSTGTLIVRILFFLSLCTTALVLSFLFPRQLASVGTIMNGRPGEAVLVGLAALLLVPVLVIVLCLTVVGIPLGLFLLCYFFWLAYLSQMGLGVFLGYRLFGFDGRTGWALFGPVALGILAVQACTFIPIASVVVEFGGLIFGVGALLLITQDQFLLLRRR